MATSFFAKGGHRQRESVNQDTKPTYTIPQLDTAAFATANQLKANRIDITDRPAVVPGRINRKSDALDITNRAPVVSQDVRDSQQALRSATTYDEYAQAARRYQASLLADIKHGVDRTSEDTDAIIKRWDKIATATPEEAAAERDATKAEVDRLDKDIATLATNIDRYISSGMYEEAEEMRQQMADLQSRREETFALLQQQRADVLTIERRPTQESYDALRKEEDFAQTAEAGESLEADLSEDEIRAQIAQLAVKIDPLVSSGMHDEAEEVRRQMGQLYARLDRMGYLTKEEKELYYYLYAKDAELDGNAAGAYSDFMQDPMNARKGAEQAKDIMEEESDFIRAIRMGAYGFGAGLDQWATGVGNLSDMVNGEETVKPTTARQYGSSIIREGLGEQGFKIPGTGNTSAQTLYDLATTAGQALPMMLTSKFLSPAVGMAMTGSSAMGNAYGEAISQGYSGKEAFPYAVAVGASEALLERMLSGIGGMTGKLTGKVTQSVVDNINKAVPRVLAKIGVKSVSEGGEEYLQAILEPVYRNLLLGENNEVNLLSEDAVYSYLLGSLSSLALDAPANTVQLVQAGAQQIHDSRINRAAKRWENYMGQMPTQTETPAQVAPTQQEAPVQTAAPEVEQATATPQEHLNHAAEMTFAADPNRQPPGVYVATAGDGVDIYRISGGKFVLEQNGQILNDTPIDKLVDAKRIAKNPALLVQEVQENAPAMETETDNSLLTNELDVNAPGQETVGDMEHGAVGAAEHGFSGEIGGWKRDAEDFVKDTEIPKYDKDGGTISDSAGSMFEANVPKETKEMIERYAYEGKFSYQKDTNPRQVARVHEQIGKDGFDAVYERTLADIENKKASADITAAAAICLVQAANRGDHAKAAVMAQALRENSTNVSRALQAMSILAKLSPHGRLMAWQRKVDKINRDLSKGKHGNSLSDTPAATQNLILKEVADVRDTALRLLADIHTIFSEKSKRDNGEPVENWMVKIGQQLAEAIEAKPKQPKPTPITKIIKQDLFKFAKNDLPKNSGGVKRTYTDVLRDYFANKAQYQEAWQAAKDILRQKYKDSMDTPDFIGATMTFSGDGSDNVITHTIAEALAEQKINNLDIRNYLGDRASLSKIISDQIIAETEASGGDADVVRGAVDRYLAERGLDKRNTSGNKVDRGIRETIKDMGTDISQIIRSSQGSKDALSKQIAQVLIQKYGVSQSGAGKAAKTIVQQFNQYVAQQTEKALENHFKPRTQKEAKSWSKRFREMANMGAFTDSRYAELAAEELFGAPVKIDQAIMQQYLDAKTPEEIAEAEEAIKKNVGKQMPTNLWKAIMQYRYFSLLANVSTHRKNILSGVGNTVLLKLPKDIFATGIEAATDFVAKRVGDKQGIQRTKAIVTGLTKQDRALIQTAYQDAANVRDELMANGKYNDQRSDIEEYTSAWKLNNPKTKVGKTASNILQAAEKAGPEANKKLMDLEDFMIAAPNYAASLAGYMKANGLTQPTDAARAYAIQEALEVVGRDSNAISDWVAKLGTSNKVTKFLTSIVLMFKHTPANMFVRAVEYKPLVAAVKVLADVRSMRNNPDSEITAADIINDVSKGLSGAANLTLGFFLAAQGLLRGIGVGDEEERELQRLDGELDYSLVFGDNEYYTINQFSPSTTQVITGAVLWETIQTATIKRVKNGEPLSMEEVLKVVSGLLDPLMETSPFEGINDVLDVLKNSKNDEGSATIGTKVAVSLLGSLASTFVPTLVSRISNARDEYARSAFADKNSDVPSWIQYAAQDIARKTLGGRENMALNVDAWGRPKPGGKDDNWLVSVANVFKTGTYSQAHDSEAHDEIVRLYQETGENMALKARPNSYFNDADGNRVDMTAKQYDQYRIERGDLYEGLVAGFADNDDYEALDGKYQCKILENAQKYVDQTAKAGLGLGYEPEAWVKDLEGASPEEVMDAVISRTVDNILGDGEQRYDNLGDMLDNGTINDSIALSVLPTSAVTKYEAAGKGAGVTVTQFVDSYGVYQSMEGENRKDQFLQYVKTADLSTAQRVGLAKSYYKELPTEWLIGINAPPAEIVNSLTGGRKTNWNTYIKGSGISVQQYWRIAEHCDDITGQDRKDKVTSYINSLSLSDAQKTALFRSEYPKSDKVPEWD